MYHNTIFKMDNQQSSEEGSTEGTLFSVMWLPRWDWREWMHVWYIWLSPYSVRLKQLQLLIVYAPAWKTKFTV